MNNTETIQITQQGNLMIQVLVQDKATGQIIGTRLIKRSELARMYNEYRVHGSKNGKSVVEY